MPALIAPHPIPEVHPYYALRARRWQLARAAFIGGDAWFKQGRTFKLGPWTIKNAVPGKESHTIGPLFEENRLWRHPRERDLNYLARLRASPYENVFRPHIETLAAAVARSCKKVELPDTVKYLESNTDRWGQDIHQFRLRRIVWAHVYGHCYTLMDKPKGQEQPSEAHERAAGIRTYLQILTPLDLLDWSWNAEGMEFNWALVLEQHPEERTRPDQRTKDDKPEKPAVWTRLFTREGSQLFKNGVAAGPVTAGPGFVPITVQFAVGQDPDIAEPVGIPINDDTADMAETRFNQHSWLIEQEMTQCFNQAMLKSKDELTDDIVLKLGTSRYINADDFRWVAPDISPMEHLIASIGRASAAMRQVMGLETKGEGSEAAKSGLALQMEQQNVSSLFSGYVTAAEAGELRIWKMAAAMEKANPEEVSVEYSKDFSHMEAASRHTMILNALEKGDFKGMAKAELQKQLFLSAHPEVEDDKREEIFADIDEAAREALEMPTPQELMAGLAGSDGEDDEDEEQDQDEETETDPGRPTPNPFAKQQA